jgi:hypothetical protein
MEILWWKERRNRQAEKVKATTESKPGSEEHSRQE